MTSAFGHKNLEMRRSKLNGGIIQLLLFKCLRLCLIFSKSFLHNFKPKYAFLHSFHAPVLVFIPPLGASYEYICNQRNYNIFLHYYQDLLDEAWMNHNFSIKNKVFRATNICTRSDSNIIACLAQIGVILNHT